MRLALGLAVLLFLVLRLWQLDAWPLFIDEAQHLHWSLRAWTHAPFLRPLTDGKALQVALAALVVPFVDDPVRAGRLLSVAAGGVGFACCSWIGRELGGDRAGVAAALLDATCPFLVVHERLALADPFAAAAMAGCLALVLLLLRQAGAGRTAALGVALGAAVAAKVPAAVAFAYPIAALASPAGRRAGRGLILGTLVGAVLAVAPVVYFLRHTAQLDEKATGPEDAIAPGGLVLENVGHAAGWLITYLTLPVALAALAGVVLAITRGGAAARLVALGAVLPVALFLPVFHWFPRYALPAAAPALALAAWAIERGWRAVESRDGSWFHRRRHLALAAAALVVLGPPLVQAALVAHTPLRAAIPAVDRFQYLTGWPSGAAGDAAWRVVRSATPGEDTLVVVDAAGHSTMHYVLRTRLMNDPRTEVLMTRLEESGASDLIVRESRRRNVFVVETVRRRGRRRRWKPAHVQMELVARLVRLDGVLAGRLYRARPISE